MSITTFAQLMTYPTSRKIALVEMTLAEYVIITWTLHSGNVYKITWGRDTKTLADGTPFILTEETTAFKSGIGRGADTIRTYTQVASTATCIATSYSWYHDLANTTLYVNFAGSNPNTTAAGAPNMVEFKIRMATERISLDDGNGERQYIPYVATIPRISSTNNQLMNGIASMSVGTIVLSNMDGYFDSFIADYIWENKDVKILYGGESLPYSEYAVIFRGTIVDKEWSRESVVLSLRSYHDQLMESIPRETFTLTSYPNCDPNIVGQPIPLGYGTFGFREAPLAKAIDESTYIASNAVKFKFLGHAATSINAVYISYDSGASWVTTAASGSTPPGSANQYTPDAANGELIVRFTVSSYVPSTNTRPWVKVLFTGYNLTNAADITEHLLLNYTGFTSSNLDSTAFITAKSATTEQLALYLNREIRISDVIDKICKSVLGYFVTTRAGLFALNIWTPSTSTITALRDEELLTPLKIKWSKGDQYTTVKVGYSQSALNDNYLYESASDTYAAGKYENTGTKVISTYLTVSSDAQHIAQRYLFIMKNPVLVLSGQCKWQLGSVSIGDRVAITTARAPFFDGVLTSFPVEISGLSYDYTNGTISFTGKIMTSTILSVGFWMAATASSYSTATAAARATSGFWADANGEVVPGDVSTRNISIWW